MTVVEDPKVSDEQLINAIHKLEYTAEVVSKTIKIKCGQFCEVLKLIKIDRILYLDI